MEAKRKKETYKFLKALGRENRGHSIRDEVGDASGAGQKRRVRVEIYDWRLLEEVFGKDEVRSDGRRHGDWRKWWVGCLT